MVSVPYRVIHFLIRIVYMDNTILENGFRPLQGYSFLIIIFSYYRRKRKIIVSVLTGVIHF